jgi:predicted transposase/invertase (TIGR01784 family)
MEEKQDPFYDKAYKSLFSHPQMVEGLLKDFVQESWVEHLDFSTLEKVSSSYITRDRKSRETDVIYKIKYGNKNLYIYILIEFQSTVEKFMALRVLNYVILFYEDLLKQKKIKDKLPFVFPMVLYNGDNRWTAPVEISKLINYPSEDLTKYLVHFSYNLISVNTIDKQSLAHLKDAVQILFYLENSDGEEFDDNMERISDAIFSISDVSLKKELYSFLVGFTQKKGWEESRLETIEAMEEVKTMLRTSMEEYKKKLIEKGKEQGIEQGIEKGKEQGIEQGIKQERINVAKNMIKERVETTIIAKVTGLSVSEIKELKES